MEDLDTLNDPDLAVMCQLLGTSGVFEVKIPPRAKVAWLKNSVITELFQTGSPLSIDDIKLVYCGKVLCDADVVGMAIQKVCLVCIIPCPY